MKKWSEFLEGRCWPGYKPKPGKKAFSPGSCMKESAAAAVAAAIAISKKKSGNYDKEGFRKTTYKNPDHPNRKSNTERESELKEDLRKWFSKTDPKGGWKRINSKGEAIGPCAREPGEAKPKCMSNEKRASLSKKERASAVSAKRRHDPNPERKGQPINVSNFGKGKISENMENLDEKNVPTSPEKWAQAKSQAKAKFDVYPSAYANGWASKKYKEMGGGWKSVSEAKEESEYDYEGDMARGQLQSIINNAQRVHDMLKDKDNLPEWVQSKITLAEDYISTVANYMMSEVDEGVSNDSWKDKTFGPTKVIQQKYKVKTDTKTYNVKAETEAHAHKLVSSHTPGSKIVSIEHKGRFMEEVEPIEELSKNTLKSYIPAAARDLSKKGVNAGIEAKSGKPGVTKEYGDHFEKRYKGIIKATRKLAKESVAKTGTANMPADIGTPAQLSLRVTPKKLETPVYESRQLEIVREAMADAKKKDAAKKKEQKVNPGGDDKFQSEPELTSSITKNAQ
jgi:hypothetical protein